MILKQWVKNEQIKRKQTCSVCFVKVFRILRKRVQGLSKEFLGNNANKKLFLGKATSHNDHYKAIKSWRLAITDRWPALICSADEPNGEFLQKAIDFWW